MLENCQKCLLGLFLMFGVCNIGLAGDLHGKPGGQSFGLGKKFVGLQLGYGDGVGFDFMGDGDGRLVSYLAVFPHFGIGVSNLLGRDSWYQGNFDIVIEGEFIRNFKPSGGYSAGAATLARYNFRSLRIVTPYIEAGGGIGYLDFNLRNQSDGVTFYPQVGAGFRLSMSERVTLNLGYRLHHMSNAGIHDRNNSINANLFLFGFSYFLD